MQIHPKGSVAFGLCPPEPCAGTSRGVFSNLARLAPAINYEVATFIPRNFIAALGGELIGAAIGALGRGAARTVTFYRGVSAAEAADASANGLRAGRAASGNEGKYLTNTVEAAAQWGARNGPGNQVLSVTLPADATSTFRSLGRIDGIGEAWWAPIESLKGAQVSIVKQAARAAQ